MDSVRKMDLGRVYKGNPNHGADGRFVTSGSSTGVMYGTLPDITILSRYPAMSLNPVRASVAEDTPQALDIRKNLNSTKATDNRFEVQYQGNHIGSVQNVSMTPGKQAWVAYHDFAGSKSILSPTTDPWNGARPTGHGYDVSGMVDRKLAYRPSMEQAMNDMSDLHAHYLKAYRSGALAIKSDLSIPQRKQLAKEGEAMPDGSYPIRNASDLHHAIELSGMGSDGKQAIRDHIKARAKALGLEGQLPDSWKTQKADSTEENPDEDSLQKPTTVSALMKQQPGAKLKKPGRFSQAIPSPMDISSTSSQINSANS